MIFCQHCCLYTCTGEIFPFPASAQAPPSVQGCPLRMGGCSRNHLSRGHQTKLQSGPSPRTVSDNGLKGINSHRAFLNASFVFFTCLMVPINICTFFARCISPWILRHGEICQINTNYYYALKFCQVLCKNYSLLSFSPHKVLFELTKHSKLNEYIPYFL